MTVWPNLHSGVGRGPESRPLGSAGVPHRKRDRGRPELVCVGYVCLPVGMVWVQHTGGGGDSMSHVGLRRLADGRVTVPGSRVPSVGWCDEECGLVCRL